MADVHLRISIHQEEAVLEHLATDQETLVNGESVTRVNIVHGDEIQFGQTQVNASIEKVMQDANALDAEFDDTHLNTDPHEDFQDLEVIAKKLDFSDDAIERVAEHQDASLLLEDLKTRSLWEDAVRLQAFLLPKSEATSWVIETIDQIPEIALSPGQRTAYDAAAHWAAEPSEEQRRVCEKLSTENENEGIGGMLALAAFFSEGSIAPAEAEDEVYVEDHVASMVLAGVVANAVAACPPQNTADLYQMFLNRAKEKA